MIRPNKSRASVSFHTRLGASWLFGCMLLLAAAQVQAQTKLRLWNIHAEGYPVTVAVNWFAEQINKGTQGRYQVEVFSNATLGDQPKAVAMLKAGELDLAEFSSGPLSDAVSGIKVLNLPFLFRDSAHMFRHLDGRLGERFAKNLAASGFVVLGWYDGGARSFYCVNPTVRLSDLTGKRIRVQKSEIYTELIQRLDSAPQFIPFKEVQAALQTGAIDCAENNLPSYESTGHYKLAKHVYLTNHVISPEALVVSTQLWGQLSKEDQAIFQDVGLKSARYMRELWNKRVADARAATTAQGSEFVNMKDAAGMIRRMGSLYGKYMADPTTREELLTIVADQ
jgi:tripartite ATP-independent transporter DctP family solute receptor